MMKNILVCLSGVIVSCNFPPKQEIGSISNKSYFSKVANAAKNALKVGAEVAIDASSAAGQININGKVDLKDFAILAATGQLVGKTVSIKNTNYSDKQKVVNRMESKVNPNHRQQNIDKTNKSHIKASQVSNTAKTTTNTTVKNTTNNLVNKVKDDEKK